MAYFEFPHTRTYEGDLGYIIKKLNQVSNDTAYLMEEFSKIVILTEDQIQKMIDAAIADNNIIWARELTDLKTQITTEYKAWVNARIDDLTIYIDNQDLYYNHLSQGYSEQALQDSKDYTDAQVLSYNKMINPITGVYEDVRNVVNDIVTYFHMNDALTAAEYDALDLTAAAYDAYDITAYDYDFSGKTILNP